LEHPYKTGRHKGDLGVFYGERYFTVTGKPWNGNKLDITDVPVELLKQLCDPIINYKPKTTIDLDAINNTKPMHTKPETDEDIISIIKNSANSSKFQLLMDGDISGYPSNSEADMALASMVAFYSDYSEQIIRIMRYSRLSREKWNREDYLPRTVARALELKTASYDPEYSLPKMNTVLPISCVTQSELNKKIERAKENHKLPLFPDLFADYADMKIPYLFKNYMGAAKVVSYSLEEYHFASLLAVASMAIGRRASVDVAMTKIYPNVFCMIVGHTTISGKSVACNIAINKLSKAILMDKGGITPPWKTKLMRDTQTAPGFLQELQSCHNNLWYYDECSSFFDDAIGHNSAIIPHLCHVYDGTPVSITYSRRGKKKDGEDQDYMYVCESPFVSLLFNTTISNVEEISTEKMFNSGFFPRFMWFWGEGGEPKQNKSDTTIQGKIIDDVASKLKEIREQLDSLKENDINFSVNGVIEQWRLETTCKFLDKEGENTRAAIGRAFIQAYKLAMIFTLCDDEERKKILASKANKVKIPDHYAKMALFIISKYLLPRTIRVFELRTINDQRNKQVMVSKALDHYGGAATLSDVGRYTKLNKKDLKDTLETMVENGEIDMTTIESGGPKPKTWVTKNC
jgi:hypothetical protein